MPASGHVDSFTAKAHGHVPDGAFIVPDPNLIFNGEFKRAGLDLVLSHDGHEFVVHDYFRGDKRAAIASPDGAHLSGDTVNALTGHVQYAQAASGVAAAQVIGHVTKLSGSATAIRNGVSVILNNGDNVEKGDVVATGADTTLGITFIDGTVFGLSSNARMVLNEMVYDPNGSSNSSLLSLVAGTITFVAGETAKHGDMKIDTPVATMGIRGTAVLTQINFVVPAGGGDPQPQASFQVLVEPNGTTGSYILFDKVTLLPIATVNQAGQMIQISGGNVTIGNALMSPDVQKLITDVFTLKFTDNNSNTKLTTNFTDTITPVTDGILLKTQNGTTATLIFTNLNPQGSETPGHNPASSTRIPGPPDSRSLDLNGNVKTAFTLTEHANATGDRADGTGDAVASDTVSGRITFLDQNLGDQPTVSVSLAGAPNYVYKSAGQQDVTGSLNDLQKQDIAATQIDIQVVADPANNNSGSAIWTYTIPDHVFDFLAAGETLTLTYKIRVNNNFTINPESSFIDITITITGTNDKPVITTSVPTILFEGGTSVPGGPLTSDVPTSGTLSFDDVDLTDTHTVSVALTSATLPGGSVPPGPLAAFQKAMSVAIAAAADSTGDGSGTINWSLADLPVYLADFIPKGQVLTLVYTVTLTDSQGATSEQTITVEITGTDEPAVVWIATDKAGAPSGGFWKDAANWETGTVPTINDDVIVITDQLHGLTPSYPVTIDVAAFAKSITMNDFGGPPPKVINQSSLTIAGALNMGADSIFINAGSMFVSGKAEILDTSVLTNGGYLTLQGGGDFAKGAAITNSGTIELSGGTLKTLATIHNAGGTLRNEAGTTLIVDTATVDGGTVTILGTLELDGTSLIENGTLNNSGAVNVKGTVEFAHEAVSNNSSGTIRVLTNGWLTIDQGSNVTNNGAVTVDASGKLTINGATISGGAFGILLGTTVLDAGAGDASSGTLVITGSSTGRGTVTNNGELDLTGNAVLSRGNLNNNASLNVSGAGNALDNEAIINAGTIEVLANGALAIDQGSTVDNSSGNVTVDGNAALALSYATISGGAINGAGTIDVTGTSKIDSGATVSISTITVDAALTLDGVTVSGTAITDNSSITLANTVKLEGGATIKGASAANKGAITNSGTLEIAGAATLLNDILTNTGHTIKIDDGQTLTLSGTEIAGGTINNYSGAGVGTIDVTGDSKLSGNVTLNKGAVTVEDGITLTFGDAIVAGTAIGNLGTVKVDAGKKLTMNGASLTGGTLNVAGTLDSNDTTTVTNASIFNNGLIEAIAGLLTLTATTSVSIANTGTLQAKSGELDIDHEAVTNTGTLASVSDGTLKLIGMTVTNTDGAVSVDSSSRLDLNGATIDGGTATISGLLESTGTSAIDTADLTVANGGTITVTSGTLTIDPGTLHAITNQGLIEAVSGGTLKLTTATITNTGGTISVDGSSKLYLTDVSINGGSLTNAGNLYSVGLNTVTGGVTNTGTIEVQSGTLNLSGGLTGVGKQIIIDDKATLELAGADAQTITFAGGINTLQLDKVAGQSFTGTIAGTSSQDGTFTITGAADISTSAGDALDFTASGGTSGAGGNVVLTPTGTLTGAANGVVVTQNGVGDISLTATKNVVGLNGNGITLRDSATGSGNITVNNLTGKATGTGADSEGILVENLNAANAGDITITQLGGAAGGAFGIDAATLGNGNVSIDAGGDVAGASIYAIRARSYGTGDITVTTQAGSVVTSGSSGIVAVNRAISLDAQNDSTITVNAYGTINSGSSANLAGNVPGGIEAGYTGATTGTGANTNVNGAVVVNNHANINAAAGYGINAYNYGNGDVTVNSFAGTTIALSGSQSVGINAAALSGGTGDVTISLGENVTISGATSYGIRAYSIDQGDISVTLAKGDDIASGSSGIVAVNYAAAIADGADSTISVEAHGKIHSGSTLNTDLTTPGAIIAGYKPGGTGAFSNAVNGDVTVTSDATIIADAGYGIEAFTWGVGDVTVTTGALSSITAAGTAIGAFDHGGGNVSVTNEGSATGAIGLSALATGTGHITIVNDGHLTGTSLTGISVTQNGAGTTGSTQITNSGSVVGADGHAAIYIQGNTTGTATIGNSGTIGPDVAGSVTSTTYAIVETAGAVTINNTGHINGNISVASATFNNEAGGTWTVAGSGVFGDASLIINHGAIDLHGASISGTGLSIENDGSIDSWGTASITGDITNTDTGSLEVHTGTLTLFGSLTGGSVVVDAGATLEVKGTVSQTISLTGDGAELEIDTKDFGGSIADLTVNDKIDLTTIKWGAGTSAVYVPNAGDPASGGVLTVTGDDGKTISLTLVGDYRNAHFAGSDEGGHTLITIHADDDAPTFTTTDAAQLNASFSEQPDTTGASATIDPTPAASGSINFTDIDLTDRPTVTQVDQAVTSLAADGNTDLTLSLSTAEVDALKAAFTYQLDGKNNGAVTWHYSIADSALDFLADGQTVKIVSTVTLTDEYGGHDTAEVTVTITGKNDAPTIAAVTTGPLVDTAIADTFSDITGTLVGTDADHGETTTLKYAVLDGMHHAVTTVAGLYGSLTVNEDGTYSYVPDAAAINALSEDNYTDTFTVQTTDVHGATGTATFKVNVTGANDAPVLSNGNIGKLTDTAGADSFSDLTGHITGTDADTGDTLTYAVLNADHHAVATVAGHYGALTVNSDGSYTYVPDAASINALPEGSYCDSFTVQVTDAHGAATTATYTVDLTGANDAPTLSDLNIGKLLDTAAADTFSNLTGQLAGSDPDSGDTLTYAVLNAHHHAATTVCGLYGALTVNADGSYSYVPNADAINALQDGDHTDTFTVQTTDAHGATGTATLTVDVTGANDAPVINIDQVCVGQEGDQVFVKGLSVTDVDAGADESFTLTATAQSGTNVDPASTTDSLANVNSSLQYLTYSEPEDGPATDKVVVTVADGHGATDTVNLIFSLTEERAATLASTTGKDVLFGTGYHDQFVFAANSNHDTIVNFTPDEDHINLTAAVATDIDAAWIAGHVAASPTNSADTLITIDSADTILLKGVNAANLHASDFIVHSG